MHILQAVKERKYNADFNPCNTRYENFNIFPEIYRENGINFPEKV